MKFREPTVEEIVENDFWINYFIVNYGFKFFEPSFEKVPFVSCLF